MRIKSFLVMFTYFLISFMYFVFTVGLTTQNNYAEYSGEIEHLSFETLMSFPEYALNKKNKHNKMYDEEKITTHEFEKILTHLYNNNYILIDVEMLYTIKDNTLSKKQLFLPQNKKPIILSFNNVSYKSNYQNLGNIDKIIIDRNNQLASYTTKKSIQDRVQYNNEFMLILENFITHHPDFSFNNARGIMFFSGENGILGYNINSKNASSKNEARRVIEVVSRLKKLGWKFGCNTAQHLHAISDVEFAKEISLWIKEIKSIIGNTQLYSFTDTALTISKQKQETLLSNGFKIFFKKDISNPSLVIDDNTITMTTRSINGNTLRNNSDELSHLFNSYEVYDHDIRQIKFPSTH